MGVLGRKCLAGSRGPLLVCTWRPGLECSDVFCVRKKVKPLEELTRKSFQ